MSDFSVNVDVIPNLQSILLAMATFFVMYLILKKILHEPVSNFLEERSNSIQTDIDEAANLKLEALELKDEYESRIQFAKDEAREIVEEARLRGEELETSILNEAREEARNIKQRAEVEIAREKATALEDVQKEVGDMALLIASKILDRELELDNQNQLIDEFIDEVGSSQWKN